jgi:magnesium transporter
VSPIYYVTFTTAVLTASFVLFEGFNIANPIDTTRLLGGFLIIFFGVYMLNFPSKDLDSPEFERLSGSVPQSPGIPRTRFSMQGLRPSDDVRRGIQDEGDDGYMLQSLALRSEDREAVGESIGG